ncbi:hypothetical protein ACFFLZ_12630 [Photobacterium aphoticum]|uniref:hypothetical protein n=1 Tax=Photobacterium aphoticum TaxID=754436 RepID=UPI00069DCD85|nr:hypothetical protein [Photobacterium aphoticum]PSU57730.1 hypothetical protein C9I90_08710 [Photobacterium aphoticum]GHA55235.1 hypothetical protein GCM10007086_31660 [Photobacterium aphoticum]
MGLFKNIKDGFRGKPDFSSLHGKTYQIDDHLLTFSVPHNVTSSSDYHKTIKLDDFDCLSNIDHHEVALKMGYVEYYFNTKIVNPLLPINSPGKVFLRVKLKKSNLCLDYTESLSCFLEKNYFEYFHDPIVSDDSMRGMHTKLMNKAHDFANRCWGVILSHLRK